MVDATFPSRQRLIAPMPIAFTFPGQGSQHVGMGKALAEAFRSAREVYNQVDEALGQKLSALMWDGPEDELTLTENAQPALMAVSIAVLRVLEIEHGIALARMARCVAGHSLGEYSALAAAGALSLADAARLLRMRGRAMQQATPVGTGAMAAVLGLDYRQVVPVAAEAARGEVCQVANDNAPGQVVVSGHRSAVERAVALAKAIGAKRAVLLQVSAPFHCSLMQPAARVMADALEQAKVTSPLVPLIANVTASPLTDSDEIRDKLVTQVTATVRWRECVGTMAALGVGLFLELGAGKVLTGLVRRNAPQATGLALATPEDIIAAIPQLT
jgi:[acyl-carrier-protein] S-malonyltransferase